MLRAIVQAKQYLQKVLGTNKADNLQSFIARTVAGTFGLRVANAFLGYSVSLLLARFLGAKGYGTYAYALAWLTLLQIPATLGLGPLLIREIAVYQTQEAWGLARGLLRWANQAILLASVVIAAIAAGVAWTFLSASDLPTLLTFLIAMVSLPLMCLERTRQASMQALNRIVVAQVPELILRPLLLILLLTGVYVWSSEKLSPALAMGIYAIATTVTFIVGVKLLQSFLPNNLKQATPEYQIRTWLQTALPLLLMSGMYIINNQTDTIMLGALKDTIAVGIYTVANRGAGLITFVLVAFNTSLAPTFANLYANGDKERLQRVVTKSCRLIFLAALPIALGLILLSHWFLLLFGSEFLAGKTVLAILCLGQLANAFTGSVAVLLNMTGHQNDTALGVTISAGLNVILNALFIPRWGAEGAAIATASSTILWNISLVFLAHKRLKIYSTPLG